MRFRASAEVFKDADPALNKARRCVEPFLNAAFATSSLATLEALLRYVPIVMPPDWPRHYPARSKLRKKDRIYDCAPRLNYEVFVEGSFENERHAAFRSDFLQFAGHEQSVLPAFDDTWTCNQEQLLLQIQFEVRDAVIH